MCSTSGTHRAYATMTFAVTQSNVSKAQDFVIHPAINSLAGKVDPEKGYIAFDPTVLNEATIAALEGVRALKEYSFIQRGDGKQQSAAGTQISAYLLVLRVGAIGWQGGGGPRGY